MSDAGTDAARVRLVIAAHLRPLVEKVGALKVAGRLGLTRQTVNRWCNGSAVPSCEQWEPLAAALGLDHWHDIFPAKLDPGGNG